MSAQAMTVFPAPGRCDENAEVVSCQGVDGGLLRGFEDRRRLVLSVCSGAAFVDDLQSASCLHCHVAEPVEQPAG
ncbi:MAG TPA: hypothetical protein VGJ59_01200 [Jatrophihabitantaceae bacterium]|jgi:hypothetical protein